MGDAALRPAKHSEQSDASLNPYQSIYMRCMSGTLGFNAERTRDTPELLDVTLFEGGPKLSTKCPLFLPHKRLPTRRRNRLSQNKLCMYTVHVPGNSHTAQPMSRRNHSPPLQPHCIITGLDEIADSDLSHPDAHAGSVSIATRDLVPNEKLQ
ncbi:hypothetical protein T492DRAFT_493126 [Pavlovales sp. CCMP2436]|nr:hypothetical protein T492DRAFT_493126 [Pavlovales sp. CCMP2436]